MKRKDFNKMALLGAAAGFVSCNVSSEIQHSGKSEKISNQGHIQKKPLIKPKKLKEGDTVGLIAPGSPFSAEAYERALTNITQLGFKYKNAKNLFLKYGYLAGDDKSRIEDIHQMFADPEVDAIWCVRGGYGTTRLLYDLDYELIQKNPKILLGYSDITALLQAIHKMTGLVTFHGPVASTEMTDYIEEGFRSVLMSTEKNIKLNNKISENDSDEFKPEIIVNGHMKGQLAGGNLTLLSAMAGTPYQLDATDKLIFIEDVGEKPYRIDRMLTQLRQTANLKEAHGIVLGVFNDCNAKPDEKNTLSLKETLIDRLGYLDIPVFYGFSFGHIDEMCTIPVGIEGAFVMDKQELVLFESAVV